MSICIEPVADIYSDFPEKFGIPRQSGLAQSLVSKIVFRPKYRNEDAVRGIEGFSHIWILWQFSENTDKGFSATVRPPRLGGNKRMGVFATRSPFRPNNIGLSSVKLLKVDYEDEKSPVLYVGGADIMDNTPVFDIKPYLPYTDSHPDAIGGFAEDLIGNNSCVLYDDKVLSKLPEEKKQGLLDVLKGRPIPSYHDDEDRVYGMSFAGFEVSFKASNNEIIILDIK